MGVKKKYKLDNTAKFFSLDCKDNINVFRYTIFLKERVNGRTLKKSVQETIKNYPEFKVKMAAGIFWKYLKNNNKTVIVNKDSKMICDYFNVKDNNNYLFKVTYFKNRINLDVIHVLTDGTGAIELLKSIVYNYLNIKHHLNLTFRKKENKYIDQYIEFFDKKVEQISRLEKSYRIPNKIDTSINNTSLFIIDISEIKKICQFKKVTITEYLTAKLIYAIYLEYYKPIKHEEIIITVPVNLRNYYDDTLANFFKCIDINSKINELNLKSEKEILKNVHEEFKKKINIDNINTVLNRDIRLEKKLWVRMTPLFGKKIFMKCFEESFNKGATAALSNVGSIKVDDIFKKYIDNIFAHIKPGKYQKIKCTICSYNNKLNVVINSNIINDRFANTFKKLLKQDLKVKLK